MRFSYRGRAESGEPVSGEIMAEDLASAVAELKQNPDIIIIDVQPVKKGSSGAGLSRLRGRSLILLLSQVSYFLKAGIPLIQGLEALERDYDQQKVRNVLAYLRRELEEGRSFSHAIRNSDAFPELLSDLVEASEETGRLDEMLFNFLNYLKDREAHRRRVMQAVTYPVLVILVLIACIAFLSFYVFPKFVGLFVSSGIELPALTQWLYDSINFVRDYAKTLLLALVGLIVALGLLLRIDSVRESFDRLRLAPPLFGTVERDLNVYIFLLTFYLLYRSGLRFQRIGELLPVSLMNRYMRKKCDDLQQSIERGEPVATSMENTGLFPSSVLIMVKTGEKAGTLEDMLFLASESVKTEMEFLVELFLQLLEPALLVLVSGVVAIYAVAILLPILELVKIARM